MEGVVSVEGVKLHFPQPLPRFDYDFRKNFPRLSGPFPSVLVVLLPWDHSNPYSSKKSVVPRRTEVTGHLYNRNRSEDGGMTTFYLVGFCTTVLLLNNKGYQDSRLTSSRPFESKPQRVHWRRSIVDLRPVDFLVDPTCKFTGWPYRLSPTTDNRPSSRPQHLKPCMNTGGVHRTRRRSNRWPEVSLARISLVRLLSPSSLFRRIHNWNP